MKTPSVISDEDIRKYLKKHGPASLDKLAEHFGEAVLVVRVNQGFRDFIWKLLHRDSGIEVDEQWRLICKKNNGRPSNLHLLQKWSLNEISREKIKEHD